MDQSTTFAVQELLGTNRGADAIPLLDAASQAAPFDAGVAHDRLAVSTLFGTPRQGLAAIDHLLALTTRSREAGLPADNAGLAGDIVDVVPLVLARFGAEELIEHLPHVAERARRLLAFASMLPHDADIARRLRQGLDMLWTYDDPRTGVTRHVYRPASPHTVQVEPTNRCNLKCTMCPRTTAMQRPLVDMTVEQYARLLAGWSGATPKFQVRIHAFGSTRLDFTWPGFVKLFFLGEILMHESFAELVRVTRDHGAAIMPMTNGMLLAKRSVRRKIVESDIQQLGISLDGIDATSYEAVRNGATWISVRDAILALCDELEAAGRRSALRIHVNSLIPDDPDAPARNRDLLRPILERVDSHVQSKINAAHTAVFVDGSGRLTEFEHRTPAIPSNVPSCFETLTKLNVLSDGRMTPCCTDIDGDLELGRMERTIDEVWNGPATLALHRAHLTHRLEDYAFCRHCLGVDVDPVRGLVHRRPLERTVGIG